MGVGVGVGVCVCVCKMVILITCRLLSLLKCVGTALCVFNVYSSCVVVSVYFKSICGTSLGLGFKKLGCCVKPKSLQAILLSWQPSLQCPLP